MIPQIPFKRLSKNVILSVAKNLGEGADNKYIPIHPETLHFVHFVVTQWNQGDRIIKEVGFFGQPQVSQKAYSS